MTTSDWHVLVIEDEPDSMELVQGILEYNGIDVVGAKTGEEALTILEKFVPTLVIIDLSLPGIDGWGLLDHLQHDAELSQVPRIAMTAYHTAALAHEALQAGFDAYIPKPIDAGSLVNELMKIVGN